MEMERLELRLPARPEDAIDAKFVKGFEPVERPDPGYISFDKYIDSVNVVEQFVNETKALSAEMRQWVEERDFHRAALNVKLESINQARGVKRFSVNAELVSSNGKDLAQIDDVAPDTEWVDAPMSAELELDVTIGFLGEVLKFIAGKAIPLPGGHAKFTYKWNPKVGKIISGGSGVTAEWDLSASEGKYVDGGHRFELLVRRPRSIGKMKLVIKEAWAHYDMPWGRDVAFTDRGLEIPINFRESDVKA